MKKVAVPTAVQRTWHDMELGMFIHWGPITYLDGRGGDVLVPVEEINPVALDTDAWIDTAVSMGARYVVFVAKHAHGFCAWPTETTEYCISNTPWKDGQGDIVAEVAQSCAKKGVKLGLYLSPADKYLDVNVAGVCADPAKQEEYNQIYRQQLTELLTRYGPICEVWFDGSLVVDVGDILTAHAPEAVVFQSPFASIRWVGNEDGIATYPAWNAVSAEDGKSGLATNLHGRPDGDVWLPLECDARITDSWFWSKENESTLKCLDALMEMYYRSVGHGAVLLLNQTPDKTGRFPEADAARAKAFGDEIRRRFSSPIAETSGRGSSLELRFPKQDVDHVVIAEDIQYGERIHAYLVEGLSDGVWTQLASGTAVGHKKIDHFAAVACEGVRLTIVRSAAEPQIRQLAAYFADVPVRQAARRQTEGMTIGEWGPEVFYGHTYGRGAAKDVTFDLTSVCREAGQYLVEFAQTHGANQLLIESVLVSYGGQQYPDWVTSVTDSSAEFVVTLPGVGDTISIKARVRGDGGKDSHGRVFVRRIASA